MTGSPACGGEFLGRDFTHLPQIANAKQYSHVNNRPLFMSTKFWADFNQYFKLGLKPNTSLAEFTAGNYRFGRPPHARSTVNRSVAVLYLDYRKPS